MSTVDQAYKDEHEILLEKVVMHLLPIRLRDKIVENFLNIPACTGSYSKYEDIAYGVNSYYSQEFAIDSKREMKRSANNQEKIIGSNVPILAALSIVKNLRKRGLNILDIGGATANEYFMCKEFLGDDCFARWLVLEKKELVDALSKQTVADTLRYASDIKKIDHGIDVVIISGALQYLPRPIETIRDALALNPECFLITKTPYWDKETRLTRQLSWKHEEGSHGGRLSYPFWILNEGHMMKLFKDSNYNPIFDFPGQRMYVTEHGYVTSRAILFRKNSTADLQD